VKERRRGGSDPAALLFDAEPQLKVADSGSKAMQLACGTACATAAFDDPFAAVADRAAVVAMMAELIVPIASFGRGRKPQFVANDSG
jgi:hypothetical protein